jgi:hypothetical protein
VFEDALASADRASWLAAQGDLVTAYAHTYRDGDAQVACFDFDTGAPVVVPLSDVPTASSRAGGVRAGAARRRTAVEEAAALYREAARRRRAATANAPLLAKAQAALAVSRLCSHRAQRRRPRL